MWGDTAVVLRVPYTPTLAPPYDIVPTTLPAVGQGTCGSRCLDLAKASGTFDLAVGDLARMQIQSEPRLVIITSVNDPGGPTDTVQVQFANLDSLIRYPAGLSGLQIPLSGAFVQKLAPVVYWPEGDNVMRAERFRADGSLMGDIMASGVQSWEVTLIFTDGDELDLANATDGDGTNDFDDNGRMGVDDAMERETMPPYTDALRGLQIKIRVYEPDSRQVRQVTVVSDFTPE